MTNRINITPEKTAITNGTSTSCKMIVSDFKLDRDYVSVLDYGCGKLRNSKYLIENGFSVSVIDTEKQIQHQLYDINKLCIKNYYTCENINFKNQYEIILLSFVLNVVPDINDRNTILSNIYNLLKDNGVAYIEVRDKSFLKKLKNISSFKDGVLTGNGQNKTFQKPYTIDKLVQYLTINKFKIVSTKKTSNSIIAKIKKRGEFVMKFGQITNNYKKYSQKCDYIQFDICGLNKEESILKLKETLNKNPHISSIILHSDWTKKGFSENNFPTRINDYIEIYKELSKYINVIAITLHPMFRSKITLENFLSLVEKLELHLPVYIENRSNSKILVSNPDKIVSISQLKLMTIDIPQLLISCNYNYDLFLNTINRINWNNVKEVHLANLKRDGNRTYVGRSLDDGIIDINDFISLIKDKYITFEILGGEKVFEKNIDIIKSL